MKLGLGQFSIYAGQGRLDNFYLKEGLLAEREDELLKAESRAFEDIDDRSVMLYNLWSASGRSTQED